MKAPALHKLFRFGNPPRIDDGHELQRFNCAGREIEIPVPPPGPADVPSALAFSLHKSGSTLLQRILTDLAPVAGVSMLRLESEFWDRGAAPGQVPPAVARVFQPRGCCYGVFRTLPWRYRIPILDSARKILLVRDPRDALVSHYFSVARSHPAPKDAPDDVRARLLAERERVGATSIDEHVLANADFFKRAHWRYIRDLLEHADTRVYRYEDVIFDKRAWIDDLCDTLGWDAPPADRDQIARRHDKRPADENPGAHVRRVTPGDHREKLRPETIQELDEIFAPVLDRYAYPRTSRPAWPSADDERARFRVRCDDRDVVIHRPPPGPADVPSALAFSLHKSGSTLLQKILLDLAPHAGVSMLLLESEFWNQGVALADLPPETAEVFEPRSYCYGVFRVLPPKFRIPILDTAPAVFLVRDPRDALVSHYFSVARSHPAPSSAPDDVRRRFDDERRRVGGLDIDEHVLSHAEFFRRVHDRYIRELLGKHDARVYRYEDVIFEKRAWVDDLCTALGWDVPEGVRREVADRHDRRPQHENAAAHIRRVTPGDHREKLRPETIRRLDEILGSALDRYAYPRADTPPPDPQPAVGP